jgi:hypothetical protein
MAYRGLVKGGVVVFPEGAPPEGADVRVELLDADEPQSSAVWDKLARYSGAVEGLPADMARRHDHYIHGAADE